MSLESYLKNKLNIEKTQGRARMFMDAMKSDDPGIRETGLTGIVVMATSFISRLEDFVLHTSRAVTDEELDEIIKSFYEDQGYEATGSSHSWIQPMLLKKDDESLSVSVTNDSWAGEPGVIYVTVSNWPY